MMSSGYIYLARGIASPPDIDLDEPLVVAFSLPGEKLFGVLIYSAAINRSIMPRRAW